MELWGFGGSFLLMEQGKIFINELGLILPSVLYHGDFFLWS